MNNSHRDFISNTSKGGAAVSFGAILRGFAPKSYGNIIGANNRITVASRGVNSRGLAVGTNFTGSRCVAPLYSFLFIHPIATVKVLFAINSNICQYH
jgi:hypothetical protein